MAKTLTLRRQGYRGREAESGKRWRWGEENLFAVCAEGELFAADGGEGAVGAASDFAVGRGADHC